MSRDSPSDLPDALRKRMEAADEDASEPAPPLEALWTRLGAARPSDDDLPDATDTWAGIQRHLDAGAEEANTNSRSPKRRVQRPPRPHHRRFNGRWAAALVVVLLVVVGAWWWQRPVAVTAAPGTSITHTLPDGSTVELNGGSRLTYPRTMNAVAFLQDERRTVRVQGEAYFEVAAAGRPFVVRTATARIEVTGTAFAVRTDADQTHVALAGGHVRVTGRTSSGEPVSLSPGEAVFVGPKGALSPPTDTSLQRVTAWRRGGFAVTAQPLPAIAQRLQQQFGTPITLSPALSADVTSSPLSLYYSQDVDIETILQDIAMARGLSYRPRAPNGYVLGPADRAQSPSDTNEPS